MISQNNGVSQESSSNQKKNQNQIQRQSIPNFNFQNNQIHQQSAQIKSNYQNSGTFMQSAYNGINQDSLFNHQQRQSFNQRFSEFKSSSQNDVIHNFKQFKQNINLNNINSYQITSQNIDKMEIEEDFVQKQMQDVILDAIKDGNQFQK